MGGRLIKTVLFLFVTLHSVAQNKISELNNVLDHSENCGLRYLSSINGLYKSDGINNKKIQGLTGSIIQGEQIHEPCEGVWFTTYNALHYYSIIEDSIYVHQLSSSSNEIITSDYNLIGLIRSNELLIKLKHEFCIFNTESNKISKYYNFDLFKYYEFGLYNNGSNNYLIASNYESLIKYNFDNDEISSIAEWNNSFTINKESLIFTNDIGEICEFDIHKFEEIRRIKIINSPITWVKSVDEHLYATDSKHILIIDSKKLEIINKVDLAKSIKEHYTVLNFDIKNNLYFISTANNGYLSMPINTKFSSVDLSPYGQITSIINNSDSSFFALSRKSGVLEVENNKLIKTYSSPYINSLKYGCKFNDSLLLLSNWKNLLEFNISSKKITKVNLENNSNYFQVNPNNKGQVFTSQGRGSLSKIELTKSGKYISKNVANCPSSISSQFYTHFFFDNDDRLFVSNNDEMILVFEYPYSHPPKIIPILGGILSFNEKNGSIILSNYSGVFKIDKISLSFEKVVDKLNLLDKKIYGLLIDDNDKWWMSSDEGILSYDSKTKTCHSYSRNDGLQGLEYNTMSYAILDSNYYFGGERGLNFFDPLNISLSSVQAKINITDFQINGISNLSYLKNAIKKRIDLNFNENTLEVHFNGIDFQDPSSVDLKYKLENYDDSWILVNKNAGIARYPNLPAGSYKLKLNASNVDGIWSSNNHTIEINIKPPWYQTYWAISLFLLAFGSIVYFAFKSYYSRKLKEKDLALREANITIEKQSALSAERTRIASEMHDDIGGGLTTIRSLSRKVLRSTENHKIKNNIDKIVLQSETLVNNMSEIIWAMNSGFDSLNNLISYTRVKSHEYLEDNEFNLSFRISGNPDEIKLSGVNRRNIFLVVKETLHNAVKHSEGDSINIKFDIDDYLTITIQDNGLGIQSSNKIGNGMNNMKIRMKSINGTFETVNEEGLKTILTYKLNS